MAGIASNASIWSCAGTYLLTSIYLQRVMHVLMALGSALWSVEVSKSSAIDLATADSDPQRNDPWVVMTTHCNTH